MSMKMKARRRFVGIEGDLLKGEVFEPATASRARALEKAGLASFVETNPENTEAFKEPGERVDAAKTHKDLDGLVLEYNLANIPTKEDGANMDERKTAIKAALV